MITFSQDDISRLAQIVRDETGNTVQEKNHSMLESRMRNHLAKCNLASMAEYWKYFSEHEKEEREALKSLMTTHYTFFFREYAHFENLEQWIESESTRLKGRFQKTQTPVRVWSAACSRGHEVYSLAMFLDINLLKKHGVPFEIVGTDIDPDSVKYAKNGVYPIKEVNAIPQNYLNPYWKKGTGAIKDFAAIQNELKKTVRFEALNLLETTTWTEKNSFDVIFCRNVFIYFSPENVRQIALGLLSRMDEKGLFVSGMSEPLRFQGWDLQAVGPSCYRRLEKTAPTENKGTVLPLAPASKASPKPIEVKTSEKYRVLCVDDSPTIQKLMKKIFSQDPLCEKVDTAEHGGKAAELLKKNTYELITLDIHMPEVNGIEFLEKHYDRKSHPPVIMISSVNRTDLDLATKSISLGAFDYVEKPAMNNLQKSADEILTKAKMALRLKKSPIENSASFDNSIARKIVVPDASMCLRIIYASHENLKLLQQVIKGQNGELRSPATLIIWPDASHRSNLESSLIQWTHHPVISLKDPKAYLKPNTIYIVDTETAGNVINHLKVKSMSLQILDDQCVQPHLIPSHGSLQILLDESFAENRELLERKMGRKLSDLCPTTSFPSLSVEFFAHLRASAA